MEKNLNFVKDAESYHTGGGCMVDILTLNDGTALVISDEGIGLYWSKKGHFLDQVVPDEVTELISDAEVNGIREYMARLGYVAPTDGPLQNLEAEELRNRIDEEYRLAEIIRLLKEKDYWATHESLGGGAEGIGIRHAGKYWIYTDGHTEPVLGCYKDDRTCEDDGMFPICDEWTTVPSELADAIDKRLKAYKEATSDKVAMDTIRDLMSGKEWSPDTLDQVAEAVRTTGREVGNYDPLRCPNCGSTDPHVPEGNGDMFCPKCHTKWK